ncbi:TonB-dependent receptor plug domain-containing protein [Myxococcota bacterium]|nr:TonB-dependent receptor plug domain-containing protein [Myxococcota bacterium]
MHPTRRQSIRPRLVGRARSTPPRVVGVAVLIGAASALAAGAAEPDSDSAAESAATEEVIVYGRAADQIGFASAGSEGRVGQADLALRPIGRVGELLESVPGLIATQHSGSGKANQYFLRGFNLDHGTDFATFFDGVPVNFRTHAHGQGYTDLNFVIPELVETIDYRKGPYRADVGDFGSAGAAFMKTFDRLPESIALVTYGQYDYVRGLAASSFEAGEGEGIVALEGRTNQGPFQLDANLLHVNGFGKWTAPVAHGTLRASASGYYATWNSTDQIPDRAIGSPDPSIRVSRLGYIDPDLGGRTTRAVVNLDWQQEEDETPLALSTYLLYYDFDLFSNFTYFLDDPVNGDQFRQTDRRFTWGGKASQDFLPKLFGMPVEIRTGFDTRLDRIPDLGLYRTRERRRVSTVRRDAVTEWSGALFGEARVEPVEWLTLIAGLRGDLFAFDVNTRAGVDAGIDSGGEVDGLVSPKLAVIVRPHADFELYLNGGGGYHSNDARGTTTRVDPADPLVRQWGTELGGRWQPNALVHFTTVVWFLKSKSELVFVGDAGTTEPSGRSQRFGVELTGFLRPVPWLALDASYSWSDARFDGLPSGRDRVPLALEHVVSAGATVTAGAFSSSLRLRHFAAYPLIEDNSQRAGSTTLVNLGAAYTWRRLTFDLTVVNLFDSMDNDIQYFYASRLNLTEPAAGVPDTHRHPVEPRQLRGTLKLAF